MYEGISLSRLQVFVNVAEAGGYSAAAAHLNLSQPAVYTQTKALEQVYGTPLVFYRGHKVHLTAAGEHLYRVAKQMLTEAQNAASAIRQLSEGAQGRIILGVARPLEQSFFFERVLAPFQRSHPDVRLTIHFAHSVRLLEMLAAREVDLAYVLDYHRPAGLQYEPLHTAEWLFVAALQHPLVHVPDVTLDDIGRAGIISTPLDNTERAYSSATWRQASNLERYGAIVEVDGAQAGMLAAQAGQGIYGIWWPPYAGIPSLDNLAILRPAAPPRIIDVGLVSREGEYWSGVMRDFAAWLRQITSANVRA